ncbi:unnamed protein product [Prorocentrum cordatum]|uniref:Uncharacterized protein n=1 Tax=Prorocentrum cordatum TaxID=2364126 RepID=A0ABN9UJJ7_9DINO|nr:unnamed protein product [Polarella glacialis]
MLLQIAKDTIHSHVKLTRKFMLNKNTNSVPKVGKMMEEAANNPDEAKGDTYRTIHASIKEDHTSTSLDVRLEGNAQRKRKVGRETPLAAEYRSHPRTLATATQPYGIAARAQTSRHFCNSWASCFAERPSTVPARLST